MAGVQKDWEKLQGHRNTNARLMAEKRESVREIGAIPAVVDPARKAACREDLPLFLKTYMPRAFYLPWSPDHETVLDKMEICVLQGEQFCEAMSRGSGKTTMTMGCAIWGALYGHREYTVVIGSEATNAQKITESIMIEIWKNDLLYEDFPEICHAVRHIDGIGQRASGQVHGGKQTHIKWNKDILVLPMIDGSAAAGAVIQPKGLSASIRGLNIKKADGSVLRPDFAILDDPQTDESARSVKQCDDREALIDKAVLGLAGPDIKIAAIMPCTIIEVDDLSGRYLDHKRHPEWQGECMKMVYEWPDEQDGLWADYAQIRRGERDGDDRQEWVKLATEFYAENREAMDKGAKVAWNERMFPTDLSALQHAENLLIDRGKAAFFSEYQNDPVEAKPSLYNLRAEHVAGSLNHIPILTAHDSAVFVSAFIDINPAYGLNWVIMWFQSDMTGGVLDYGKYPKRESDRLVPPDAIKTPMEDQLIFKGLDSLISTMNEKVIAFRKERAFIDLLTIDCGHNMVTVFKYINARQAHFSNIKYMAASRGWGSRRFTPTRKTIMTGNNLYLTEWPDKGKVLVHNGDYWKMQTQKAFLIPVGAAGSISLYGDDPITHQRLSEHVTAAKLTEYIEGDTFNAYNWAMKPGQHDDLHDGIIGCCVGASFRGCDGNYVQTSKPAKQHVQPQFKQHNI